MNEIHRAQKWIRGKLAGDAQITAVVGTRIFADQARELADFPYVLFAMQTGGQDTRGVGTVRLMSLPLFQIKVVTDGPPSADVYTVADRIDELFQNAVTEISDSFVFSSRRESPVEYPEPKRDSSEFFVHYGGSYRLYIYPQA
jgi:hypothetical protein